MDSRDIKIVLTILSLTVLLSYSVNLLFDLLNTSAEHQYNLALERLEKDHRLQIEAEKTRQLKLFR